MKTIKELAQCKRAYVYTKKGELVVSCENFGTVWVTWTFKDNAYFRGTAEFNTEDLHYHLNRMRQYYTFNYV